MNYGETSIVKKYFYKKLIKIYVLEKYNKVLNKIIR